MKHLHTFESFSSKPLNDGEVFVFDRLGGPLAELGDAIEAMLKDADKITDSKWVTALKSIQTQFNKLDAAIAAADSRLGVIPMK